MILGSTGASPGSSNSTGLKSVSIQPHSNRLTRVQASHPYARPQGTSPLWVLNESFEDVGGPHFSADISEPVECTYFVFPTLDYKSIVHETGYDEYK